MFNHGNWRSPKNEGPVEKDGVVFIPVNREGKLEPIQTREEFGRLYALFNEENFLGNLNPDAISIGLDNIKFNEETKLYTINVLAEVKSPTSKKPMGRQNVNFVVKLDDLDKPQYPEISLSDTKNEEKFRDSISNVLKDFYPSIYKGLNNEAQENLIDDIKTRSMRNLLNSIIIPRLKKYRREILASLENSWNNSGLLPSQSRQLDIHNPLLYEKVILLLPNKRFGSDIRSIHFPARDYPSQDSPELN
ncbi:MAG: hypothetical protein VKK32_02300 [Candidatus Melainabacteria bacterium]|nr:hypothetical protein [Candidatus Melainabacteria bacterium]